MIFRNGTTVLELDDATGTPVALVHAGFDLNALDPRAQPFFEIVISPPHRPGEPRSVVTLTAAHASVVSKDTTGSGFRYFFLGNRNISARVTARGTGTDDIELYLTVRNLTGWELMEVRFPVLLVPPRLSDGDWVLWNHSFRQGMLIRDFSNVFTTTEKAFDTISEPMQFVAFGTDVASFSVGTRDAEHHAKHHQPYWTGANLMLAPTHFVDDRQAPRFSIPYATIVTTHATGEWYDAAEHYRDWTSGQHWTAGTLAQRPEVPAWWLESPIVLSIKERGKRNSELEQQTSEWCHPLENGLPTILSLADRLNAPFMVQVFHWEKEGAFVNGDHFPPLSGWVGTHRFFDRLREAGHHGGVYIIPHRWTIRAHTTGYDGGEFFEKMNDRKSYSRG